MDILTELLEHRKTGVTTDLSKAAAASLAANVECFVAQYFIKHPHADPKDLLLCYSPDQSMGYYGYRFWIKEKKDKT